MCPPGASVQGSSSLSQAVRSSQTPPNAVGAPRGLAAPSVLSESTVECSCFRVLSSVPSRKPSV